MYLKKKLPLKDDVQKEDIDNCLSTVAEYINSNVSVVNCISATMFQSLDTSSLKIEEAIIQLTDVASKLYDMYAITGAQQDSGAVYDESIRELATGVFRDTGTMQMYLDSSDESLRTVMSIKTSSNGGQPGNSIGATKMYDNPNNLIGGMSRFEYEKFNDELILNLEIELDQVYPVNLVSFTINNLGVRLPSIVGIEMQADGVDWEYADIRLSNKKSIDLEMFTFKNGKVQLHTSTHNAKYIIIKFHQQYPQVVYGQNKTRYAISMQDLKVMQYSAIESGQIIVGPFEFSDQILKAQIAANVEKYNFDTKNVVFYISHDQQNWVEVENQKIFNPSATLSKVVNYNTVSSRQINTTQPVFKIWIKVEMTGFKVVKDAIKTDSLIRDVGEISNAAREIDLSQSSQKLAVYKQLNFKYGGTVPASSTSTTSSYDSIVNIFDDEEQYVKGFGVSNDQAKVFDVTKNISTGLVTYALDKVHVIEKEQVYIQTQDDCDPSQLVLYKLSKPYKKKVQIVLKDNKYEVTGHTTLFPVKEAGGVYSLRTKYGQIKIDLKSKCLFSNVQALYVLPNDVKAVELFDHVGFSMGTFDTQTINGVTCVSLLNIFQVVRMYVGDRSLNTFYPLKALGADEYAIEDGKIVLGSFYSGDAVITVSRVQEVKHTTSFGASNRPYIIAESQLPIKTNYYIQHKSLVKYVKLADANIVEGSVEFDTNLASFNSFIKEVPFVDGKSEFTYKNTHVQKNNLSVNTISLLSTYNGGDIKFYGFKRPFTNQVFSEQELVRYGDWYLKESVYANDGQLLSTAKILLPPGIKTDSVLDVDIEYDIIDKSGSVTGQYSIDYINGIIYASSYIDPNVRIQYLSTNMYARYEALKWIPTTAYSIKDQQIRINDYSDNIAGSYVVVQQSSQDDTLEFVDTPIIKEFKLNVITEREFV